MYNPRIKLKTESHLGVIKLKLTKENIFFIFSHFIFVYCPYIYLSIVPRGSDNKESACNAGDLGLIPGLGRSPREWNGYPLQYSSLENSMDRGG